MRKHLLWIIPTLFVVVAGIAIGIYSLRQPKLISTPAKVFNPPVVELTPVASGLTTPTGIVATNDTGDKRLFVLERPGTIRIINDTGQLESQPFLDLRAKVLDNGAEMGLLGLAFHPDYARNGYFYINYVDKQENSIIARYQVSSQPNQADPQTEKILIKQPQPYDNHNGGDLQFGPDGFLYIALGDGGAGGDPQDRAQNKNTLLGKLLRIDVNSGDPYALPATNPFLNQPNTRGEIWAYGLRNPWRFSFDKSTGDLFIADVGQDAVEEIDFQTRDSKGGENYGWRCYEGSKSYNLAGCQDQSQYVLPILEHDHDENRCSITGGYVYRGTAQPALAGKYFYGDLCSGQLFYAENRDSKWTYTTALATSYRISTFGQDSGGELYLADFDSGGIYRIQDNANN